ncbi:hypothetical protein DMP16_09405 [Sulfolobus sp. B1]|uniref:hypothetical protein n=1 Tax=Sulfolobus sp. B1 TaxID=2200888 RepID=UPI00117E5C3C|nr:hypothetical protein [Sulfolobus sp. B1]TRM74438.1 hypothetical protein DJ532_12820 [Sulfolobus sp. A20-N-F8]TRM75534.1 hypothetical protein DJ528_09250 [Sulfolobus sp. B5]TRM84417.1 hypothetical protein DJ522_04830 [Sulfolobus sp. F3]TRM86580.1 hypothetical protein DJ529_10925 [Sulfolobus sp. C3]TRM86692.1 hypothetical protein DJ521_05020 [Sulfolobus sp. E3]TRM99028.1 hypothetical protein DJ527_09425 [Sulfolobus sp. F1]
MRDAFRKSGSTFNGGVVNALPVEATSVVFNSNATFVSSNVKGDPLISGPQHKDVKVEEFGEAGLVIDFGGEYYTAESHDALVLIYRDRHGKISTIEIEFEDDSDEPKP